MPYKDIDSQEVEPSHREDEGLYIPSYLEEAIPDDPVLQVRVTRALRVQEMNSKRCFTCNRPGHLARDHQEWEEKNGIRLLQPKGPPLNKSASKKAKQRNNTQDWLKIKKGVPIARMVTANAIPKVTHVLPAEKPHELSTLTEAERQELLLEKLDLTGLEAWPKEQAEKARSLLKEYHDIFSLEKHDTGHTKATKYKIVLKDPDTPPFKERFHRITPPQLDEVRAHLKMMLDAGVL